MKRAFTLTELLVVVVIIAILAAFLFPVAHKAKSKAQETACLSNLHQLFLAMQMYRSDNGDYPPASNQNALDEGYLGGAHLRCSAQRNPRVANDYVLNGGPPGFLFGGTRGEHLDTEWRACRNKREGEFPLVIDRNHALPMAGYEEGGDLFFLVAREGGHIRRVRAEILGEMSVGHMSAPCSADLGISNL